MMKNRAKSRAVWLLLAVVGACACGTGPAGPSSNLQGISSQGIAGIGGVEASTDSPSNFRAWVEFDSGGGAMGLNVDMPEPTFENRFRFILGPSAPLFEFGPAPVWVLVRAQANGTMYVRIDGVAGMTFHPMDGGIAAGFAAAAPGEEDRVQVVTVRYSWGSWEVLIEERR